MPLMQVPVAEVFRRFADILDDPYLMERAAVVDPGGQALASFLDALGKYAAEVGTDLRGLQSAGRCPLPPSLMALVDRKMTNELRRFADMLERKQDLVRMVDPGYQRLTSGVKVANSYAAGLGIDLGLSGAWALSSSPVVN